MKEIINTLKIIDNIGFGIKDDLLIIVDNDKSDINDIEIVATVKKSDSGFVVCQGSVAINVLGLEDVSCVVRKLFIDFRAFKKLGKIVENLHNEVDYVITLPDIYLNEVVK